MTREEFQKLTQDVVLLDGATGSNLMAAGMPRGICTEAWIMDHKEVLQNLQKAYVEAGSQIVYAPFSIRTFICSAKLLASIL